ncbi:hypothetical protein [Pseudomonas sp. BF-B-25]|uniref:hypothetical protein n=1 Tax=Pseudomonas sp. BF-B-25 TaxID=2832355 RepID=UPI001CBD7D34
MERKKWEVLCTVFREKAAKGLNERPFPESQAARKGVSLLHLLSMAEEGCDDALVGFGQAGRLALEFVREATFAHDAIEIAIENVRRAVPNARLIESALAP